MLCGNAGCQVKFEDRSNHETACRYHTGGPVFKEGRKEWSCCGKGSMDFDKFLATPGCTTGPHTNKDKDNSASHNVKDAARIEPDHWQHVPAPVDPGLKHMGPKTPSPLGIEIIDLESNLNDPDGYSAPSGQGCLRPGCKKIQAETQALGPCTYHPGQPIFHESSKGWSCCSRRVLEFDHFLKIEGCASLPRHRFTGKPGGVVDASMGASSATGAAGAVPVASPPKCRVDWYQTPTEVVVDLFCKHVDRDASKIELQSRRVIALIVTKDNKRYEHDVPLSEEIVPEDSVIEFLSTKIELTLRKANGFSWVSLEPVEGAVRSFTTFGATGGGGTVGAKQAILASDSPIHRIAPGA